MVRSAPPEARKCSVRLATADVDTARPHKMCDIRFEMGEQRRAAFLEAITSGSTITDACSIAGWTNPSSYRHNRRRYPMWAYRVDYYRTLNAWPNRPPARWSIGGPGSKWPFLRDLTIN
jgi:hypothetical protein